MIKNSNNPSNNQHKIAASIIAIDAENGKDEGAIALPYFPRIGSDDCPEINFNEIPAWEPPQTQIILPKSNSDKDEEEIEYIRHLASSESLNTREQIDLFFQTLGFNKEDRIYIRCIPAKNIPSDKLLELGLGYKKKDSEAVIKKTIKGYIEWDDEEEDYIFYENRYNQKPQKHPWGIQKLEELNKKGYGTYFVVGQGGDNDEDIIKVDTLFYECDGINKDKQWEKQKKLYYNNKLSPIAIVETRNSIHVYYRREDDNDDSAKTFRFLQQRLIQLADSDPAIHNEARLMRLPGFDHVKWNDGILEFFPCILKLCDFNAPHYSDIDFHETLPKWDEKRWGKKKKQNNSLDAHNIKNFSQNIQNNGYYSDAYNIKNFAPFLEAGEVRPHEIETYKCPAHNGTSNNSLHIFPNGAFKCHGGCDNRDIWRAAKDIAVAHGYVLPEKKQEYQKSKQKSPEQLAQDNAQFEAEKIIHGQLTGIDFEKTKQLGITITRINKEKLSPEDLNLEKGKISIVCSAKGTGKTEGLQPYIPSYKAIYSWHTRVTLAIKMAYDLGLIYKNEIDNYLLATKASFCANSAYKFHPKVLQDNALLLFDECDQIFDYTFESLCNKDGIRPLILATHKAQLAATLTKGSAAYMSADISQKEIDYIIAIAPPNAKIELVVNDYKPKKGTLKFSTDGKPDSAIKKLLTDLDNGVPCFLLDDFKNGYRGCKTIAEFIRKERPDLASRIVEINGDTSEEEEIKDYVKQINEASVNTMLLSCSPSIISGISLTNGRFNKGVYGIINGILTPNNGSQGFARIRGAENISVWVASSGINYEASRATTPSEVDKYYQDNYTARNKILLTYQPEYNPMKQEWHSPHWQLFCQNSALKNLEMRRLRYWYQQKLIDDGYELIETGFGVDASGIGDSLKEIAGQLKLQEILQISDAKDLSFHEVQQLSDKSNSGENLTLEERQQLTKYHLIDTFGDELIAGATTKTPTGEELFGLDAIAFMNHRNGLENSMKRFYRNFHQETADIASSDTYIENRQQNLRPDIPECNKRFPKDIKWQLRERKLWEFLDFKSYLDPNKEYYPEDYQPLIDKVRKYIEPIKQATGYNFEKTKDGQIIDICYGMNGLRLSSQQKRVDGSVIRVKRITQASWDFAQKFVQHQLVRKQDFQGVTTPPIFLVKGNLAGGVVTPHENIHSKEHSHFDLKNITQVITEGKGGVVTPEYEQLNLDLGDRAEYQRAHQKDQENYNDYHDIYSYQDGD
jgi:hypothetical protein